MSQYLNSVEPFGSIMCYLRLLYLSLSKKKILLYLLIEYIALCSDRELLNKLVLGCSPLIHNQLRVTGMVQGCHINYRELLTSDAQSVLGRDGEKNGKGYLEDRRLVSNMDLYVVTTLLAYIIVRTNSRG